MRQIWYKLITFIIYFLDLHVFEDNIKIII
jgi:hypothetical protein